MNFAVRPMQPTDLDSVFGLAAGCPEAPQWPAPAYASYLTTVEEQPIRRAGFVAEQDGWVLGFAVASLLLDGTQNLCQLDSLAVRAEARSRGIGRALLDALLTWAGENGARHFSLEVRASNAPALALYHRAGFQPEGRRLRYYAHPEEDALLLGRPITSG
jgi:[ribosomal protein S18]-alanine N-acetyltransferase